MKKSIFRLSLLLGALIFIVSCSDNDQLYQINVPADGAVTLSASKTDVVLNHENSILNTAVTFHWDSLTYGISTPVNYKIQIDSLNGDFSHPISKDVAAGALTYSFTDSILNKAAIKLKLSPLVQGKLKFRLLASLDNEKFPVISKTITLNITPFTPPAESNGYEYIYLSGIDDDWTLPFARALGRKGSSGEYVGYIEVNSCSWNWQLRPKSNTWDYIGFNTTAGMSGTLAGLGAGTQNHDADFVTKPGYYRFNVDVENNTYAIKEVSSFCVTGDFNGWSTTANPMTYDKTTKLWKATCNISVIGWGIQILGNGDWGYKYGDNGAGNFSGALTLGGANIMPTSTGTKTITMDLSKPGNFTYTIE